LTAKLHSLYVKESRAVVGNFVKRRGWSRTFNLRFRNPAFIRHIGPIYVRELSYTAWKNRLLLNTKALP